MRGELLINKRLVAREENCVLFCCILKLFDFCSGSITSSNSLYLCLCCYFRADDLSSDMCLQGLAVQSLHGDREQCDREEALKDFKESK